MYAVVYVENAKKEKVEEFLNKLPVILTKTNCSSTYERGRQKQCFLVLGKDSPKPTNTLMYHFVSNKLKMFLNINI